MRGEGFSISKRMHGTTTIGSMRAIVLAAPNNKTVTTEVQLEIRPTYVLTQPDRFPLFSTRIPISLRGSSYADVPNAGDSCSSSQSLSDSSRTLRVHHLIVFLA